MIDPEDREELDPETDALLSKWAARTLHVADDEIADVAVEVTGGCGEGTCEFTTARAEVRLTDGRVFEGPNTGFGLFIRDVVAMDVKPDGTLGPLGELWKLRPASAV